MSISKCPLNPLRIEVLSKQSKNWPGIGRGGFMLGLWICFKTNFFENSLGS